MEYYGLNFFKKILIVIKIFTEIFLFVIGVVHLIPGVYFMNGITWKVGGGGLNFKIDEAGEKNKGTFYKGKKNKISVENISLLIFLGKKNKLCSFKVNKMSVENILLLLIFLGKKNKLCSFKGNNISV